MMLMHIHIGGKIGVQAWFIIGVESEYDIALEVSGVVEVGCGLDEQMEL